MEGLFIVKDVLEQESFQGRDGQQSNEKQVVLCSKEPRSSEGSTFIAEQDYVCDLIGDKADGFNLGVGAIIAASLSFGSHKGDTRYYQDVRLTKYMLV